VGVGDTVAISVGDRQADFVVTGEVVLPELGDDGQLGRGAFLPLSGLEGLIVEPARNISLVELEPDASRADAIGNIDAAVTPYPVQSSKDGNELLAVTEIADPAGATTVMLLAAPLLVTIATVMHVLVTSIRRRRRDLAVLRSLGFGRRHVLTVVATQAVVLLLSAVLIGVPIGVVAGRLLWTVFADSLGVPSPPVVPVAAIVTGTASLLLLSAVISLVPGALAGRIPAAEALRIE
jgi:ABC-type antimicrobial peptide transport system permease subunit